VNRQLDVFDHCPAKLAAAYRAAAETSRKQFPTDDNRARYYEREAERYERMQSERGVAA